MKQIIGKLAILAIGLAVPLAPLWGQPKQGKIERVKVHGTSLEGNLSGDSPDRDVSVYLPPSYEAEPGRHFPVVYMLHGFTDDDSKWFGLEEHWINLPETIDQALAAGTTREVIVVMPNAYNRFKGSMYSNSVTIGDWETFVSKELVAFVDSHYRTIPKVESRGLTGHSMGGYGTIRLGMQFPEVFSSIYLLSPCCMELRSGGNAQFMRQVEAVSSVEEIADLPFFSVAILATAAAWAPNPTKPPFYLDLPTKDGEIVPEVAAKLAANATHIAIHQHIPSLKRLKAIAFDVGTQDMGIAAACKVLDQILNDYGIPHTFETYEGNHLNRIAERIKTKMLPFFSQHLSFE